MERLLLRPVEAAEAIGVGRSKVYELLASGELPSIRIGGSLRVPVDALRAWIARQVAQQTDMATATPLAVTPRRVFVKESAR
jgi:excisionase family DNA binding protein